MNELERVASAIARCVHKHGGGTAQEVRTAVGPPYRPRFVDGAALAVQRGWIRFEGDVLRPGFVQPPGRSSKLGDLAQQIRDAAEARQ